MLGISGTELVIILFFGFLIFGPEKLPQMGRTVGRAIRQFRQASDSMNKKFQEEVKDPFEDAVAPVRDAVNEAGAPIRDDINAINDNLNGIKSTITDPFKDAFNGTSSSSSSSSSSSRPASRVTTGVTASTTAPATSSSKPAASKANPADEAFEDPFANIGDDGPISPAATKAESPTADSTASAGTNADAVAKSSKPKGQPLPTKGGSVGKSIAAQLYELDSKADAKDGE